MANQPDVPVAPKKALIQEITPPSKGILKNSPTRTEKVPAWKWSQDGPQIVITISVPDLVSAKRLYCFSLLSYRPQIDRSRIQKSTLDIEERRLIFNIPALYALDINLDLSVDLPHSCVTDNESREQFTTLKRARTFDVNNSVAEWRVAQGIILIHV